MTSAPESTLEMTGEIRQIGFRRVVLHADDFGFNEPITRGIVQGFERGVLTSTSALANAPFLDRAITFWKSLEERRESQDFPSIPLRRSLGDDLRPFDFGVHLNLTQGRPLTGERYPAQLLDRNGFFPGIFVLFAKLALNSRRFLEPLRNELDAQLSRLKDSSLEITHLNGHQYVEIVPGVAKLIPELCRRFNISVIRTAVESHFTQETLFKGELENWVLTLMKRHYALRFRRLLGQHAFSTPERYFGAAHMARIDSHLLSHFLNQIPLIDGCEPSPGQISEICLHPATHPGPHTLEDPPGWTDPFPADRPKELQLLESPDCFDLLRRHRVKLSRLRSLIP